VRDRIACVVEGHGEVQALPILIRRIVQSVLDVYVDVPTPLRLSRGRFAKDQEFERFARFAAAKAGPQGAIFILADADDDCPVDLAASRAPILDRLDVPSAVVLANRQYESWFLTAASSLSGQRGLSQGLAAPPNPEDMPNPKRWLEEHHQQNVEGRKRWCYSEVTDQPALTAVMDLAESRRSSSLDKLFRDVVRLIQS